MLRAISHALAKVRSFWESSLLWRASFRIPLRPTHGWQRAAPTRLRLICFLVPPVKPEPFCCQQRLWLKMFLQNSHYLVKPVVCATFLRSPHAAAPFPLSSAASCCPAADLGFKKQNKTQNKTKKTTTNKKTKRRILLPNRAIVPTSADTVGLSFPAKKICVNPGRQ